MNLNDLTESEIKDILFKRFIEGKETTQPPQVMKAMQRYETEKKKRYEKYHTVLKYDPTFIAKNRENAKNHYYKNKTEGSTTYKQSPETAKAKNLFRYYQRLNRVEDFQTKHPDKWQLINPI